MTEKHLTIRAPPVATATLPGCSIDDLSSELINLIFEHLRDIDPTPVYTARLVCRRFNRIAVPVVYRTITLDEHIVAPNAQSRFPGALAHIEAHTRHVVASNQLEADGVQRILASIRNLDSLTWRFNTRNFQTGNLWLPAGILSSRHTRGAGRPKLIIDDIPLRDGGLGSDNPYFKSIPNEMLVSLTMGRAVPLGTTSLASLKELLLSSRRLTTFGYWGWGQGTQFEFAGSERLPAFHTLILKHYNWQHSRQEVAKHWDLSQLTDLQLISVPLFNFFSSVPPTSLSHLRTFKAEDYSAHLPDRRREATQCLYTLVRHHTRALEVLDITCHTKLFSINAIVRHASTLRSLTFRDHVGFSEDDERCPTLKAEQLVQLASALIRVHTLELDLDVAMCDDTGLFLRALGSFANLRTLTLHVQTVVDPQEGVPEGEDVDFDQAMRMFKELMKARKSSGIGKRWERITINVGGWRRIMVRRLDAAWRTQNGLGVFAERCFVLERRVDAGCGEDEDEDELGGMSVREEMSEERF